MPSQDFGAPASEKGSARFRKAATTAIDRNTLCRHPPFNHTLSQNGKAHTDARYGYTVLEASECDQSDAVRRARDGEPGVPRGLGKPGTDAQRDDLIRAEGLW